MPVMNRTASEDRPKGRHHRSRLVTGLVAGTLTLFLSCQKQQAPPLSVSGHHAQEALAPSGSTLTASCRRVPLDLPPIYRPLDFLEDKELSDLLIQYVPSWEYRRVPDLLHALRLWGADADFRFAPKESRREGIKPLSGRRLVQILTTDSAFQEEFGKGLPYLLDARFGFSERMLEGYRSEPHVDDFLGVAAEVGLPLDTPLHSATKAGTLANLLEQSFMSFDIQQEIDFTTVAYAGYLPPAKTWVNRFGTSYTFDDLVTALLKPVASPRSCSGTHVPFSLLRMWRANRIHRILSDDARVQIENYLKTLSQELAKTQSPDGYWSAGTRDLKAPPIEVELGHLRVTGHHLEWMAFAPPEFCPPLRSIRLAAEWVHGALRRQPRLMRFAAYQYPESSHAVRALFLLHGKTVSLPIHSMPTIAVEARADP